MTETDAYRPFQRDEVSDARSLQQELERKNAQLEAVRSRGELPEVLRLAGQAGETARVLGRLEEALAYLEEALDLAGRLGDERAEVANLIRLATVLQYRDEHPQARRLFEEAVGLARRIGAFEDFALQHLGKCLVELGQVREGIECFEGALSIRRRIGAQALIRSSQTALDQAQTLLDGGDSATSPE